MAAEESAPAQIPQGRHWINRTLVGIILATLLLLQ